MQVLSFKMIDGSEVVATVKSTKRTTGDKIISYSLQRPHILQFQPMGQGQLGLAFVPWTLSNPDIDVLDVPAEAVILSFAPAARVEQQYLQQTSKIEIAKTF